MTEPENNNPAPDAEDRPRNEALSDEALSASPSTTKPRAWSTRS
jgi:hypothetical protein